MKETLDISVAKLPLLTLAEASVSDLHEQFRTSFKGLFHDEAARRLEIFGYNEPVRRKEISIVVQILTKFLNPLVVVLLIIAGFSLFFGEQLSALFVSLMALMSVGLSFVQEYKAGKEAEKLSEMVRTTATVYRNGRPREIDIRELVPGDIVDLFAGDMIPADLRILSCKDLFINQSSLTGESLPVEKTAHLQGNGKNVLSLSNIAYMGSSVVSGTALAMVIKTGANTQFGELIQRLATIRTETSFEKGINKFTWLMVNTMFVMVVVIFLINALFKQGDLLQAFLFSLAVAIGLTPQMLPMIVTINLSQGAIEMSKKLVIVKRLNSIQNLGAMDVLCTDKTGTLTKDKIVLEKYCDVYGNNDERVLHMAYINSYYQTGLKNLLDKAILNHTKISVSGYHKIDEIPFDFNRKMMSVVVEDNKEHLLITKGSPESLYSRCEFFEINGEIRPIKELLNSEMKNEANKLREDGFRVLAVAYKRLGENNLKTIYSTDDEKGLILRGYVAFLDPPKPSARRALYVLNRMGVDVKVLTGDNEIVAKYICSKVGINIRGIVTSEQLDSMNDQELQEVLKTTNIFARVSPTQKERIIHALQAAGHTVGYLGDGINDAAALKAADVGISVDNAVDIAKESADIILLKKSLLILEDGITQGRKTFGNIIKYIKMSSSSNFGNMLSMTGASLFLPFLPMAPIQILLNNFLYDISQIAIPSDNVDREYLAAPKPWNVQTIRRFMLIIGPVSSLFDFITFAVLLFLFQAGEKYFHTGWFIVSLCTQTLIIHVIRTNKIPFVESMPSKLLIYTSLFIIFSGITIAMTPIGKYFGFVPVNWVFFSVLINILILYMFSVQLVKQWFVRKYGYD